MARVLCIGGLDATGRAGLLADTWAVRAAGAEPLAVATALTAQGGRRFSLNPVPLAVLSAQLDAAFASGVDAVKLGMIADRAQLSRVARLVKSAHVRHLVVDPVTRTSRGERLSSLTPSDYHSLASLRPWLLPNVAELAWFRCSAASLVEEGFAGVLVKGGDTAADILVRGFGESVFRSTPVRRDHSRHRGTGCRLASAIAAHLSRGEAPERAIRRARALVLEFLSTPIMPPAA